jgi:2-dehydro-3-deoxy-D-arabinonate dehydratase
VRFDRIIEESLIPREDFMPVAKLRIAPGRPPEIGFVSGDEVHLIDGVTQIGALLNAPDMEDRLAAAVARSHRIVSIANVQFLPPIDSHEVWGAGVTYERSKVARQEESLDGGTFYDQVYRADRPELFFKATPSRVAGPGSPIRVRRDSIWSVPEPELALMLTPDLRLVGFTIGNDVSARDIEGRNPLYLPQAKVYASSCALGPYVATCAEVPNAGEIGIHLDIERDGVSVFNGSTSTARMARRFEELIDWLGRDNLFPDGVVLLTGTGIVPPDEFHLCAGDLVRIRIDGVGELVNPVAQE